MEPRVSVFFGVSSGLISLQGTPETNNVVPDVLGAVVVVVVVVGFPDSLLVVAAGSLVPEQHCHILSEYTGLASSQVTHLKKE